MAKAKVYRWSYPEKPPEWYWVSGLHDACIVGVEMFELIANMWERKTLITEIACC